MHVPGPLATATATHRAVAAPLRTKVAQSARPRLVGFPRLNPGATHERYVPVRTLVGPLAVRRRPRCDPPARPDPRPPLPRGSRERGRLPRPVALPTTTRRSGGRGEA